MKKTFLLFAALALAFVSCKKDGGDDKVKPLDATLTFAQESVELVYGEPSVISGTIQTSATVSQAVLTGVKGQDEASYVAVGEAQTVDVSGLELAAEFFADSKEMTAVEVKLVAGKQEKTFYLPAIVTGDAKGTVWMNDAVTFKAAPMIGTYENDPDTYPVAGTGAGCDLPSFFSMRGVEVNGEVKHVLSLTEAREVMGSKVSMSWVNVLQNTSNKAFIGSQRGLAFVRCNALTAGTVGRQCDVYEVNGKKLDVSKTDNDFGLSAIRGSWSGDRYDAEEYKFVDKLFLDIKNAETNLEKIKAFWQLSQIQQVLDNATLGVEDNPTNLSNKNMYRRYVDAGETSTKAAITEEFRAGDYLIIRTNAGTTDAPEYLYGIIQILLLPDDSGMFTLESEKVQGKMCLDKDAVLGLYEAPAYFAIKTQCDL